MFVTVRPASKAKVDKTADALRISAAQIIETVIEQSQIDDAGVVGVALELVKRARGAEADLPVAYGTVPEDTKKKLVDGAKRLKVSQAVLMDAILQQAPVNESGVLTWAEALVQQELFEETKLVS